MTATDSTHDALLAELQCELDEVRRIRAELEQYRDRTIGAPIAGDGHAGAQTEGPVSRRAALRTAGVVAAGALAGGAALLQSASPAAAYTSTGTFNATASSTEPGVHATASSAHEAIYATASDTDAHAIRADSAGLGSTIGVWGSADYSTDSVGVKGSANIGYGVVGLSTLGFGVVGQSIDGPGGFFTTNTSTGMTAASSTGRGAQISSQTTDGALITSSSGVGLRTFSNTNIGGVLTGTTGVAGVGIAANGDGGIGVFANGDRVSVHMVPSGAAPTGNIGWTYRAGDLHVDQDGSLWYCVQDGTGAPSRWRRLAATSTAGSFNPITPSRVYDSRRSIGVVTSGSVRTISVANSYDASTGALVRSNIVPAGATAVAANITITGTTGTNNFCVNPGGDTTHGTSMINWYASGQTAANAIIVAISSSRQLNVVSGAQGGSAHVIVDVTGYWL